MWINIANWPVKSILNIIFIYIYKLIPTYNLNIYSISLILIIHSLKHHLYFLICIWTQKVTITNAYHAKIIWTLPQQLCISMFLMLQLCHLCFTYIHRCQSVYSQMLWSNISWYHKAIWFLSQIATITHIKFISFKTNKVSKQPYVRHN